MSIINLIIASFGESLPPEPVIYKWLVSGDSTSAAWAGATAINDLWFSPTEITEGHAAYSIAVGGSTVAYQKSEWLAYSNKLGVDGVSIMIGLNNCTTGAAMTATQTLDAIQDYVNTIRSGIKPSAKIVVAQMTPAAARWADIDPNPSACQQRWEDINEGIATGYITGVNGIVTSHVPILGDVDYNLKPEYESVDNDHIHTNDAGREVCITALRAIIDPMFD